MIDKQKIEEIVLNILNKDSSSFVHLMNHDRKRISQIIAQSLDDINEEELKHKRKEASDEILSKLNHISELGKLHDKLKEIPFYKLSERSKLKLEILELESKTQYGWI